MPANTSLAVARLQNSAPGRPNASDAFSKDGSGRGTTRRAVEGISMLTALSTIGPVTTLHL